MPSLRNSPWTRGASQSGFPMLISRISRSQLSVMTMTEHKRGAAGLLILSAAVNVVASVFFISILGLTGAAIATTIMLTVCNVATAFFICSASAIAAGYPWNVRIDTQAILGLAPLAGTPDTLIQKPALCQLIWIIDIAKINDDRMRHLAFQSIEIKRPKLLPFGYDDQSIGTVGTFIRIPGVLNIRHFDAGQFHANRIKRSDGRTHILQRGDKGD